MKKIILSILLLGTFYVSKAQTTTDPQATAVPKTNIETTKTERLRPVGVEKIVAIAPGEYVIMNNTNSFTITPAGMKANKNPSANHNGTNTIYGEGVMQFISNAASYNVGIGLNCLNSLNNGSSNVAIGAQALSNNLYGNDNVAMGDLALSTNYSASKNVAIGSSVMYNQNYFNSGVPYDLYNIGVGFQCLFNNNPTSLSNGDRNIGIGGLSLTSNSIGRFNLAIGTEALTANTIGNFNIGIGNAALKNNVIGVQNTAVGINALAANLADNNVAFGNNSLFTNTNGTSNTALGNSALFFSQGDNNVAIGYLSQLSNGYAGRNVSVGVSALSSQNFTNANVKYNTDNIAIGFEALKRNDPNTGFGLKNIAIGTFAADNNLTGNSNIALGFNALNVNSTGGQNIAIGEGALNANTASSNTAVGVDCGTGTTTGIQNTFLGRASGNANITGGNNTFIGYGANATSGALANATAIGFSAIVNASDKVRIGNGSVTVIEGQVAFTNPSDRRLKENINYENTPGLNFIKKLKPVSYNLISDRTKYMHNGFIAQDIEQAIIESGVYFSGLKKDNDGMYSLAYSDFVMPLVNAVKEQQQTIDEQKIKISQLDQKLSQMAQLEARLSQLEATINLKTQSSSELKSDK
jgi:trimeric autotransporter adhesin